MGKANEKVLFWASFFTLIAAGMGFSIRGDILNEWGRQFGFTQTDLGIITGQGLAGFGTASTPGSVVRTPWKTADIWVRRDFTLPAEPFADLQLLVHHQDDAEV